MARPRLRWEVCCYFLVAACAGQGQTPETDHLSADELLSLTDTTRGLVRSVRLEFHSTARRSDRADPVSEQWGTWLFRDDGFERVDLLTDYHSSENPQTNSTEINTPKQQVQYIRAPGGGGQAHIHPSQGGRMLSTPRRILPLQVFRENEEALRDTFRFEGWATIRGQRCMQVSFVPAAWRSNNIEPSREVRYRYWIDPARDVHVVRYEWTMGQDRMLLAEIELAQCGDGSTWFPVSGEIQSYHSLTVRDGEQAEWTRQPSATEHIEFKTSSIELNPVLDEAQFAVNVDTGTMVVDHTSGQHYFSGGRLATGTPTPPPSRDELDESLRHADAQRGAIEASSLSRSGYSRHWYAWIVGVLSVSVLSVAVLLYFRNR